MTMENRLIVTAILMVGSTLMIAARRYKNTDSDAGIGIVFGTFVVLIGIWCQ